MNRFFPLCFLVAVVCPAAEPAKPDRFDVSQWVLPEYPESFFQGRAVGGAGALTFWMQSATYRADPSPHPQKRTQIERLWSGDAKEIARVNAELQSECQAALKDIAAFRKKAARPMEMWILLALRARDQLTPETQAVIEQTLRAVDLTSQEVGYLGQIETPGGNGANVHGHLTPLALGPEVIRDDRARATAYWGFRRELDHMNTTGDLVEFNLLESHWTGTADWEVMKRYVSDPNMRRMARLVAERLWINRFLTWSPAVERNTGPGSRMAPSEWLGCDNERFLFATGVTKPIWVSYYFPWDGWDVRAFHGGWPFMQASAMVPDLPPYLQDLAWHKSLPNQTECALTYPMQNAYPHLAGEPEGESLRPKKYVNYQTSDYTLGSSTSSWAVNTCYVGMCAFWNNSRNAGAPLGSPERFCALYPHYVFNGLSFLDQGDIYFDKLAGKPPGQPLADDKGGPRGPWLREFIEFGRLGVVQDRNTLIAAYTAKPGTHYANLVKDKTQRASAAMYLLRWTEGTDGLFINRAPVRSLPVELQPGDWWFIEDGDVYAAVRPLEATRLRGGKTILEKRTRHIVLYEDNVAAENITGIADADWVKARSGFVVEMGDKAQYGSFAQFQEQILAGKVTADEGDGFVRHVAYQRGDRSLEMRWHGYTEEYAARKINGQDDPWTRYLKSPEFAVSDSGHAAVQDAKLETTPGKFAWLLSCPPSKTWVAYQTTAEQDIPIDLTCPAGHLTAERLPFGKVAVTQNPDQSVRVDIDASYRPFFSQGKRVAEAQQFATLPSEVLLDSPAPKVQAQVNGVVLTPQKQKRGGKDMWVIDPYQHPRPLLETLWPVSK